MALTKDQSIAKYGSERYTAWGEAEAAADAAAHPENVKTASSSGSSVGGPRTVDYGAAVSQAKSSLTPLDTSQLSEAAQSILASAKNTSDAYKAEIPTVQNIYSSLAAQLEQGMKSEVEDTKGQQTKALATNATTAAASGFQTNTGFESAMMRSIEKDYNKQIDTVITNWGIKKEQLAAEEVKSIQDLLAEASAAEQKGLTDSADILKTIASLRVQENQIISEAASAIMGAQNTADANYYTKVYQDQLIQAKNKELELTATKIQLDDANTKTSLALTAQQIAQSGSGSTNLQTVQIGTDVYTFNPKTGQYTKATANGQPIQATPQYTESDIADYANQYADGKITVSQIPQDIRGQVVTTGEQIKSSGSWWNKAVNWVTGQ